MKSPAISRSGLLAIAFLGLVAPRGRAQDTTPPVVVTPIKDFMVAPNSAPSILKLDSVFGLQGVTGQMVRMTTTVGKIDVELFADAAPQTVANFLRYVSAGSYTDTIFHKVKRTPTGTSTILLGGAFSVNGTSVDYVTTFGNVANEFSLPDTRGTIAMYKQHDSPDSASDQWFFNVTDNSAKYSRDNNGGYTVFGRVIGNGMQRVDGIAGLKTYDLSSLLGIKAFKLTPLYNYDPAQGVAVDNLVAATNVAVLPLISQGKGAAGALKITVVGNTNPAVVSADVSGDTLILRYAAGKLGTAAITLQAKDQAKTKTSFSFNVTVR